MATPVKNLTDWINQQVTTYPLLDALRDRRSRRFGLGMTIPEGPFAYKSEHDSVPLTEEEEAAIVFAAAGITGYALADLSYGKGQGGAMLGGMTGRTISSADSLDTVALIVINDEATYFIKRPQNLTQAQLEETFTLVDQGKLVEAYRKLRVKIANRRTEIPVIPGVNFNINKWAMYAKGGTYFLPVNDMTTVYINAMLEGFEPEMGLFMRDERNMFLPAGIGKWAKSKGGHLYDNPRDGRVVPIQGIELSLAEAVAVEQGMMLQNISLMAQALGLGGYANFARHEYAWFEALGFKMLKMPSTKYAGSRGLISLGARLLNWVFQFPYPVGLEHNGEKLLHAYSPPYYPTMEAAVRAFVDYKFGAGGVWREKASHSDWKDGEAKTKQIKPPSEEAIQATIACCEYIYKRYGRFPAYSAPFRTIIGYQVTHVDLDFYDKNYNPNAVSETQRQRAEFHNS